jgi:anaerobic magnesium-protoporphyrin IX monomethyl ester cyclase
MAAAGFRCCATGFESGDVLLLKNMWKGQTLEQAKRFVNDARDLGILVHGCFMVGFPGETRETMAKTLALALEIEPDSAQFYPVMPFPGTTYYKWAEERGYLATRNFSDWLDSGGGHRAVLNLPGLPAEDIDAFCASAYRRFFFRPAYLWAKLKQAMRRPSEGIRSIRSFASYLRYLVWRRTIAKRPFAAPAIAPTANWYARHDQPPGRMFAQAKALRRLHTAGGGRADDTAGRQFDLRELANQMPDL